MFVFFASLRKMFAREFANIVLGALAHDAIERIYMPQMQDALDEADEAAEREAVKGKMAEWARFADPMSAEGRLWDKFAAQAIREDVRRNNRGEGDVDEIGGEIAEQFMKNPRFMNTVFAKHDPLEKSPREILKVWAGTMKRHARTVLRKWAIEERRIQRPMDEGVDPLERVEAPDVVERTELDSQTYRELEDDLVRFMNHALKEPVDKMLFDVWHKEARRKGASRVQMKRDVYPKLWESGVKVGENRLSERWRDIVHLLVSFFEMPEEKGGAGMRLTDRLRKKLRVSVEERVAEAEWRRRFCAWMLSVVPEACRKKAA